MHIFVAIYETIRYNNCVHYLKTVIENNGGIAKTSDFAANGINKYEVAAFCKEGVIERIRRGFYQLPQSESITENSVPCSKEH